MNRRNFLKLTGMGLLGIPLMGKLFATTPVTEFDRSRNDAVYFINNYVKIRSVDGNIVPLKLHPFQEQLVRDWQYGRDSIISKARQMGLTTVSVAYTLWLTTFSENTNVLVVHHTYHCADHAAKIYREMRSHLPAEFNVPWTANNRHAVRLANNSSVRFCSSSTDDVWCSRTYHTMIFDEMSWFDDGMSTTVKDEMFRARNVIKFSSRGPNNWADSRPGIPHKYRYLHWSQHPDRDMSWKQRMVKAMGQASFDYEYNA